MRGFACPLHGVTGSTRLEWVQINRHASRTPHSEVPRLCMEALGIDVTPIDSGETVWIRRDQSKALEAHEHTRPVVPRDLS